MQIVGYPTDPSQEQNIPAEALEAFVKSLLVKNRMFAADAEIAAKRMIEADLRGIVSHGSRALVRYLPAMEMADIDPRAQMLTEIETPAVAVLNGSQGIGHVTATKAMQLAIEKAKAVGTGTVVVKNSHHYGACGVYALLAAQAGMIGYTVTSSGQPNVIAPGSLAGGETNHGMAWACPNPTGAPIVLDMAVAESSWGKIHTLAEYGIPIPDHWALDDSGNPTTDGHQASLLHPIGGFKGFGLAFFSSVLTGGLGGRKLAIEKTRAVTSEGGEHFFYVIDLQQFVAREKFEERLSSAIDKIHELPSAEGDDRVTLPGELEWELAKIAQQEGLSLHKQHVADLEMLGQKHKVEIPWG
ncbi:MAG: Ldh family oxidoreductase [Planctomycetaceae bacterium]|jgi:LDH2 family malate/lactate/ureidoglycolate dehydrogenase|nr:Ldh family oxidoreductase [Planctomycetaceae bacterium]